jgi:hypothetical protein
VIAALVGCGDVALCPTGTYVKLTGGSPAANIVQVEGIGRGSVVIMDDINQSNGTHGWKEADSNGISP